MASPIHARKAMSAATMRAALILRLCADRFGYLDVDRRKPVVAVRPRAVDDAEELIVQRLGDGPHLAVADQDAVDRVKMRHLSGSAGEEGLFADVEQFAG